MDALKLTSKEREKGIYKVTLAGSIVNALLLVLKFVAGIIGNSAAMIADAVHSLSDFVTDIIVFIFVRISNKPQDKGHDYGHGKFETLATLLIGCILFLVGVGIFWNGASDIYGVFNGKPLKSPGMVALVAAVVSVLFKEILYHYTIARGKKLPIGCGECLASPQRCFFVDRYGGRYWRCDSVGRQVGYSRSGGGCAGELFYLQGRRTTGRALCGRTVGKIASGGNGARDHADLELFSRGKRSPPFAYAPHR